MRPVIERTAIDRTADPAIDDNPRCNFSKNGYCLKIGNFLLCDGVDGKVGCTEWAMISVIWQLNIAVQDLKETIQAGVRDGIGA